MFEIEWIKGRVKVGEYYFSKHGDQERQNDNLTIAEVEESLVAGRILEQYPDTGRGESCLRGKLFSCGIYRRRKTSAYCLWDKRGLVSDYYGIYPLPAKI